MSVSVCVSASHCVSVCLSVSVWVSVCASVSVYMCLSEMRDGREGHWFFSHHQGPPAPPRTQVDHCIQKTLHNQRLMHSVGIAPVSGEMKGLNCVETFGNAVEQMSGQVPSTLEMPELNWGPPPKRYAHPGLQSVILSGIRVFTVGVGWGSWDQKTLDYVGPESNDRGPYRGRKGGFEIQSCWNIPLVRMYFNTTGFSWNLMYFTFYPECQRAIT